MCVGGGVREGGVWRGEGWRGEEGWWMEVEG